MDESSPLHISKPLIPTISSTTTATTNTTTTSSRHDNHCYDSTTKEAQELFGRTIGECYGSFICSHSRIRGRLYVASRSILFYSSLLGFETKISLDFHDILEIELFRTTSILVRTFEGETYMFKSFENREIAMHLLQTHAHLNTSFTIDTSSMASSIHLAQSLGKQRHRSASSFSSSNFTLYEEPVIETSESNAQSMGNRRRCVSDSIVNEPHRTLSFEPKRIAPQSLSSPPPPTLAETATNNNNHVSSTSSNSLSVEQETWETVQQGMPFQEIAIESLHLPCSLESFFQLFLSDNAEHSLTQYQSQHMQDNHVLATPWSCRSNSNDDDIVIMSRTITFARPIKTVAMGIGLPTEAKTKREQTLWKFKKKGIMIVKNTTHIDGIPNGDAFCICDGWMIEEEEKEKSEQSVGIHFSSSFEIQFTKRSLFRSIIEKSVKKETMEWWSGYSTMIQNVLRKQEEKSVREDSTKPNVPVLPWKEIIIPLLEQVHSKWTIHLLTVMIILLLIILVLVILQFQFVMKEIRLLRAALLSLEQLAPECVTIQDR